MKLYEISDKYRLIMQELENYDEDGLIQEILIGKINEVQDEGRNKLVAVGLFVKNLRAEQAVLEEHLKKVKKKVDSLVERIDWLKYYAYHHMHEMQIDKVQDPLVTLRIQKSPPSIDYDDESLLPDKYISTFIKVNKTELKKDLDSGLQIDGARLIQSSSLRIS